MGKYVPIWAFLYFKISLNSLTFLPLAIAEVKDENIPSLSWRIILFWGREGLGTCALCNYGTVSSYYQSAMGSTGAFLGK